jgi:GNAT superfamily N-acetyltransferase
VADTFHGKGIGKVTVEKALAFLREGGHPVVWLDCTSGFLERFYESLGFVPVTRQQRFIPHAGKTLDCMLFKKSLI